MFKRSQFVTIQVRKNSHLVCRISHRVSTVIDKNKQSDVPRAMRMAGSTWKALKEFARTLGCKCDPKWTPDIQNTVFDFARTAGANFGALNTIDSNGNDYLDFLIKNPSGYLDRKIRILGVSRR